MCYVWSRTRNIRCMLLTSGKSTKFSTLLELVVLSNSLLVWRFFQTLAKIHSTSILLNLEIHGIHTGFNLYFGSISISKLSNQNPRSLWKTFRHINNFLLTPFKYNLTYPSQQSFQRAKKFVIPISYKKVMLVFVKLLLLNFVSLNLC